MSNYQILQAVALDLKPDPASPDAPAQLRPPQEMSWWDGFVEFVQDRYDSPREDRARARRQELPRLLCPEDGKLVSSTQGIEYDVLMGDYWVSLLMHYRFFWEGLWEAGNRGRVVAEFESEGSFDYEDDGDAFGGDGDSSGRYSRFALPGVGGGYYVICVDLTDRGLKLHAYYDDPAFYTEVWRLRKAALDAALEEEGVESEGELEYGYLEWSPSEEVEALYMHQRFSLIDYPDLEPRVRWEGFSE